MESRKPGKHAGKSRDAELTGEIEDGIEPATWAAEQAGLACVPAPRVSMELLERVAFLLRRC